MDKQLIETLQIDLERLEEEWLNQPTLAISAGEEAADAKLKYDKAVAVLEKVRADLDKKIRTDPSSYGLTTKLTETVVSNTIVLQPEYRAAYREMIIAKHEYEVKKAFLHAVDQRKSALENLVKLYGLGYFSLPNANNDFVNEEFKRKIKQFKEDV